MNTSLKVEEASWGCSNPWVFSTNHPVGKGEMMHIEFIKFERLSITIVDEG
jgi:hypothetical protein